MQIDSLLNDWWKVLGSQSHTRIERETSWGKKYIGRSFMLSLISSVPEYVRRIIGVRRKSSDLLNKLSFFDYAGIV